MKEWFSSKELLSIAGMPSTIQGINRKARAEKWTARKRAGVRGKALEYHISSFSVEVKKALSIEEVSASYLVSPIEPLQLWITAFEQLSTDEQAIVTAWLMRNGIKDFMSFINKHKKDS
ncbi:MULTISPECIES: DNA-binding protein [unclassified Gilliamella]|uniref:DNA-binding protein n=1 Tax=unclassified Gilliamella TaxID=2685620 RepID=UPI002269A48B|nr:MULTISPECIES: DNA-binding protein [unclassified Gilliamella]MCX8600546.1 putative DNA-binding transcriptional regulator [Gilliamella sp. B3722]MCX8609762.1 putative DNA-binding transcriptional regulator [Gilliamella sp. B3891]MCX8612148.1 putative DNA-binding transcriptional regulator [Gilliamella sp. B3773]MCX8616542.1 putative DNA-binding transcriptional regulator [Gilliamella sp. B3770]MCX8619468.1 putative DNA-binding transcriptional regulator [Gilliamella sp. B3892]